MKNSNALRNLWKYTANKSAERKSQENAKCPIF